MKKEELVAMGLTEEQADKVVSSWNEEIKTMVPKTRLDDVIKERDTAKKEVADRDKQIGDLKKDPDATETLKATIKKLQDDNKTASETSAKELDTLKRQTAVKLAIAADAQDADIVAGLFDTSKIVFDDQGNVTAGLKEQKEQLMKDKPFLFKSKDGQSHYIPAGGSGATSAANPFKKETYNLTKQAELMQSNPEQAKAYAAEAGVAL